MHALITDTGRSFASCSTPANSTQLHTPQNMKVYDLKSGNWTNSSIAVSGQYQRLIPNSPFLDRMQQLFLIAIDNIVVVEYGLLLHATEKLMV